MVTAAEPSKSYKTYNELLHEQYRQKYIRTVEESLTRNNHMNEYDGEPCAKAANTVLINLIDSTILPKISSKPTSGDILDLLTDNARVVRRTSFDLKQTTTDAILVDFINYVGGMCGVDWGLYTSDLSPKEPRSDTEARTVEAEHFCELLSRNVDNKKLTDTDFRQFVRNTLPIVKF